MTIRWNIIYRSALQSTHTFKKKLILVSMGFSPSRSRKCSLGSRNNHGSQTITKVCYIGQNNIKIVHEQELEASVKDASKTGYR